MLNLIQLHKTLTALGVAHVYVEAKPRVSLPKLPRLPENNRLQTSYKKLLHLDECERELDLIREAMQMYNDARLGKLIDLGTLQMDVLELRDALKDKTDSSCSVFRDEILNMLKTFRALRKNNIDVFSQHEDVYVAEARAKPIVRNVNVRFKTASERSRQRKLRKIWERRNKSKLNLKRKRYATRMKHRKPNPILSKRAKKVAQKYKHN